MSSLVLGSSQPITEVRRPGHARESLGYVEPLPVVSTPADPCLMQDMDYNVVEGKVKRDISIVGSLPSIGWLGLDVTITAQLQG